MILTKLFLDAAACRREKISDDYSVHRVVYSLFPKSPSPSRILYADKGPVQGGRLILILSAVPPQPPPELETSSLVLPERFFGAGRYRFEVTLNPVKKDPESHKRKAITGQLNVLNWFLKQAPKWGFEADSETLEASILPTKVFSKNDSEQLFNHVFFRGTLKVADRELFRRSVSQGLGHGKAFGFGLLQLSAIQNQQA